MLANFCIFCEKPKFYVVNRLIQWNDYYEIVLPRKKLSKKATLFYRMHVGIKTRGSALEHLTIPTTHWPTVFWRSFVTMRTDILLMKAIFQANKMFKQPSSSVQVVILQSSTCLHVKAKAYHTCSRVLLIK